ncbi:hypothetical protein EDB80DRAFT_44795 [Ilyonectria destructans]|nr:hypothetical protein EDB80DRAFT_44795 [Ilyonectria destructans]
MNGNHLQHQYNLGIWMRPNRRCRTARARSVWRHLWSQAFLLFLTHRHPFSTRHVLRAHWEPAGPSSLAAQRSHHHNFGDRTGGRAQGGDPCRVIQEPGPFVCVCEVSKALSVPERECAVCLSASPPRTTPAPAWRRCPIHATLRCAQPFLVPPPCSSMACNPGHTGQGRDPTTCFWGRGGTDARRWCWCWCWAAQWKQYTSEGR